MSLNSSIRTQVLTRACCRQSNNNHCISTSCGSVVGVTNRKYPSSFVVYYQKSSSFSSLKSWNRNVLPSLQRPRFLSSPACGGDIVRTLSNNKSKPKLPETTTTDSPSFFENLCNETRFIFQSLHGLIFIDIPILLPRLIAFAGTLHLTNEYGFKTFQCEGPSMEPTIIDGSHTAVLIDRWSHRLFGLEKETNAHVTDESQVVVYGGRSGLHNNHHEEESDNPFDSWYTLLSGIWEQHFASGLQRGDVIILHHPSREATLCKRIIGMPGDTIVRTDGGGSNEPNSRHRVVPPGHLWIEGDNFLQSLDSRSYGTVPASLVIGKVMCRLWPLREYVSLGRDGNAIEHWGSVSARIGRGDRPLTEKQKKRFNGSYLLANERGDKNR